MPRSVNKFLGAAMIVAAAGLILNYLSVTQAFLMIAIMSAASAPRDGLTPITGPTSQRS